MVSRYRRLCISDPLEATFAIPAKNVLLADAFAIQIIYRTNTCLLLHIGVSKYLLQVEENRKHFGAITEHLNLNRIRIEFCRFVHWSIIVL